MYAVYNHEGEMQHSPCWDIVEKPFTVAKYYLTKPSRIECMF